jgi:hypothetical protein
MRLRTVGLLTFAGIGLAGLLFGFQNAPRAWHEYPAFEYNDFPIPPDYQEKTEWAFGRLMYPNTTNPNIWGIGGFRRFRGYGGDWREGGRGIFWRMDYPRSDRHFSLAIRRLTRLQRGGFFMCDDFHGTLEWENFGSGRTYESDGITPRWRGIYDDKGRLMAAICHNMDLGDSWEHADNPDYEQKFSALGIRIGINYVIYALTH